MYKLIEQKFIDFLSTEVSLIRLEFFGLPSDDFFNLGSAKILEEFEEELKKDGYKEKTILSTIEEIYDSVFYMDLIYQELEKEN